MIATVDKPRFPRADALNVAREMCRAIEPVSFHLLVAGSLRRRKPTVGDVEILFIPKTADRPDASDMFGKTIRTDLGAEVIDGLLASGVLTKRPKKDGTFTWGEAIKLAVHVPSGIPVDFFTARPANWVCLTVCRTGSAQTNERICNAAIARGWKWQPYGAGFEDRHTNRQVKICRTERDVFESVQLPYLEPWDR